MDPLLSLCYAECKLEPEQHADPPGELHRRIWLVCGVRTSGRGGNERGAQWRGPRLRGPAAIGLRYPPRWTTGHGSPWRGCRLGDWRWFPLDGGVPDPGGLRAYCKALPGLCSNCEQPHRLHRGAHQGCRLRGRQPTVAFHPYDLEVHVHATRSIYIAIHMQLASFLSKINFQPFECFL